MNLPDITTAGLEDLFPVIIVITVLIARVVKAAKDNAPRIPSPPPTPNRDGDDQKWRPPQTGTKPGDELREFLESLSGAPARESSRPATPPPPPPPPVTVTTKATPRAQTFKRTRQSSAPRIRSSEPQQAEAPQPQQAMPKRRRSQAKPLARPITVQACELSPLRKTVIEHLNDSQSLRGAVLLREILGPPVALKH